MFSTLNTIEQQTIISTLLSTRKPYFFWILIYSPIFSTRGYIDQIGLGVRGYIDEVRGYIDQIHVIKQKHKQTAAPQCLHFSMEALAF